MVLIRPYHSGKKEFLVENLSITNTAFSNVFGDVYIYSHFLSSRHINKIILNLDNFEFIDRSVL